MSGAWLRRLARRKHRHDLAALVRGGKHGSEALARRGDHACVVFAEFIAQAVHVDVIDAGEAPEFLKRDEAHARGVRTAQHAPSVAMAVNGDLRVAAQRGQRRQADAVDADHHARAAGGDDQIVAAQHLVDFAGDVGRIHRPLAGSSARNSLSTRSTAGTRWSNGQ